MNFSGTVTEQAYFTPREHRAPELFRLRGYLLTMPSPVVVLTISDASSGDVVTRCTVGVATRDVAIGLLRRCEEMQDLGVSSWRRGLPLQLWAASVLRGVREGREPFHGLA